MRKWSAKNAERLNAEKRQRRKTDPAFAEKDRVRSRERVARDPTANRARARQWAIDNPEKYKARMAAYAKAHSEEIVARTKKWRKTNRVKAMTNAVNYQHRRRDRMKNTPAEQAACRVFIRTERAKKIHACFHCEKTLTVVPHFDHLIPLAKGGRHIISNLRVSCPTCNIAKGAKSH